MDLAVAKTEIGHLAVDCKVALSPFLKTSKTSNLPVMSEFSLLVASIPPVAIVNPAVGSRLDSLEKQISNLAALVKFIVEPIGSLVVLVKKNLLSMKYASNNFANLLVSMSKNIACLRSEVDFGDMDYDDMQYYS
ncbi:hypothetical protein G9A89_017968 [Geosiphon pyriformis]|nr:hypothetical protein G9A89_017968 [Geosiphon pyriformis]